MEQEQTTMTARQGTSTWANVARSLVLLAITVAVFSLLYIFKRDQFLGLADKYAQARLAPFFALMASYSLFYFLFDTLVLSAVMRWFHGPISYPSLLPVRAVTYLEGGERKPTWETVLALCEALGAEPADFLRAPAERPPPALGRPRKAPEASPAPVTGARLVVEALEREGVRHVFGYPGGAIMPVYDALPGSSLEHILVHRHLVVSLAVHEVVV